MTARVLQLPAGPSERRPERMRLKVESDGSIVVRLPGTPEYVIEADIAEQKLELLLAKIRSAKLRKFGVVPKPEKVDPGPRRHRCHRGRDGGLPPFGGCRRLKGHEGQCKDAGGLYTPAVCAHAGFGRTIVHLVSKGETRLHCQHCNADVGLAG